MQAVEQLKACPATGGCEDGVYLEDLKETGMIDKEMKAEPGQLPHV